MLVEAFPCPIRYRLLNGQQIRLTPGCPVDLPDEQARILLVKAVNRVRAVVPDPTDLETVVGEPTCGQRPVFWEGQSNCILGPGFVTHMAKETTARGEVRFWLCVEYGGSWRWIHESLLRSRATYEANRAKPKSMVVR